MNTGIKKKIFTLIVALFVVMQFSAQNNCLLFDMTAREPVFQSGEKITYTLSYTVMGVWMNVGEVEFLTTLKTDTKGNPYYHIEASGKTFSFYDKIFRVRDYFATKIDAKTLQPLHKQRNISEGSYRLISEGHFDWSNNLIYTTVQRLDKEQPQRRDTLNLTPCTFDIVSLFYYYRCCDFSKMKEQTPYNVQLAMDDKVYNIGYRLHGREQQKVRNVGTFNTLKFSGTPVKGETFTGNEQIFFWVTDDFNRVPVYIEMPIRVGSIRARLKSWENLKYPLRSKK